MNVSENAEEQLERIRQLEKTEEHFMFFLENTSDYIYFKDIEHRFTYVSRIFADLTGHRSWHELIGKTDFDVFPQEHAELYYEKERPVITEGKAITWLEEPYYNQQNELCWVSSSKRPLRNPQGEVIGLFGISRDITRVKQLEEQLSYQANYDCLTGLLNRASFQQQSEQYIELARRQGTKLAFFFIDLDNFKYINDQYGHEVGDLVLQETGRRLQACFRDADLVGRLGGDEFVALAMTDCQVNHIRAMADKLLTQLSAPLVHQQRLLPLSGSIGVACFPFSGQTFTHLMRRADHALYRAKQHGKRRFYLDMDVLET